MVKNKIAVVVVPRPDLRRFFPLIDVNPDERTIYWRKRRGSVRQLQNLLAPCRSVRVPVPDFRSLPVFTARWSTGSQRDASCPRRYVRRPRKLTPAQELTIHAVAWIKSLRSLAADFEVSHETVRAVCRQHRGGS